MYHNDNFDADNKTVIKFCFILGGYIIVEEGMRRNSSYVPDWHALESKRLNFSECSNGPLVM